MKILLGVDSTAASQVAVTEVAARPWPQGASVEVVSVVDLAHTMNAPELNGALMGSADQAIRSAAQLLQSSGIESTSVVLTGDPKDVMVDYSGQTGADLVVVGSHEASAVVRFLLGSVARAVVRFAPCSVEIVRSRSGAGAMKVLLATDGSQCSEAAVRSVASRPWPAGTEIRAISVVELSAAWFRTPYPPYFDPKAMEELRGEAMKRAQDAVAAAEQILADAGLPESGTVVIPSASPQEMILNQAAEWGADLIALGSHGRRGASRFLLGSVSEQVAFHATCSVEIVRARK
ncbi:MAG: universal stress protein [Acidobacteriia bacterium]|nr:universal stress protein [Terriglobia bacterium]